MGSKAACVAIAGEACLEDAFDEVVCAEDVARVGILDHPVSEAGDVSRSLEDGGWRHDGGVELEHVIMNDKMAAPFCDDVGLEGRSRWAIVVETGDAWWV